MSIAIEKRVIGMSKEEAIDAISQTPLKIRIRSENGKHFMGTCDYRRDRINLHIDEGKVVKANIG